MITATDSAFRRISELMKIENIPANNKASGLRISVEAGGCSGLQYKYELTNELKDNDLIISGNEVHIYIDPKSAAFIEDSRIDFIEELGASYFSVQNPNASSKCGCGNSFGL